MKMIKHIVCFKLKDNSLENCQKAKDVLMSMKGNPVFRSYHHVFLEATQIQIIINAINIDKFGIFLFYNYFKFFCFML